MSPSRRARRSIALAVLAGLTLTGCGAGINAQTNQRRTFSEGANEILPGGQILIRNFYLAPPDPGEATWHEGEDVRAYAVFVNQGDETDRLVRVTSPVARQVTFWAGGDPELGVTEQTEEFVELYQPGREARPGGTDTRVVPGDAQDDIEAGPEGVTSPSDSPSQQADSGAEPGAETGTDTGAAGDGQPVDSYLVPVGDKTEVLPGAGYLLFEDLLVDVFPGTTVPVTVEFERAGSHTFPAYVHVLAEPAERETPGSAAEGHNEPAADSATDLEAGH